ncbi:D-alanyl-D-alanine carboxypeptidase [Candidatus Gottesmanbacteria bacterium]|nr:D-alanyl-D-alanine carboxypeptidase [Candidatus Gottesmanbacteria bacterium]
MPKNKKTKTNKYSVLSIGFKILIISLFLFLVPVVFVYKKAEVPNIQEIPVVIPPPPAMLPINRNIEPIPQISAQGVYILDLDSNVTLFEKNQNTRFAPASTTKIITVLVALDKYRPEDVLTVNTVITEGRVMGLIKGEEITVENLVYGALVHSANDAAYTLAENYPGAVETFVKAMNDKALSLGLKDTHLTNPIGFEDENHYTTAYDLAQLSRLALKSDLIKKVIGTKSITVSDSNYNLYHRLDNVNILLGKVPGVAGVKTGWTEQAKEVLATLVKRDKHEVLVVILKSDDRFGETERLISWVFNSFEWQDLSTHSASLR